MSSSPVGMMDRCPRGRWQGGRKFQLNCGALGAVLASPPQPPLSPLGCTGAGWRAELSLAPWGLVRRACWDGLCCWLRHQSWAQGEGAWQTASGLGTWGVWGTLSKEPLLGWGQCQWGGGPIHLRKPRVGPCSTLKVCGDTPPPTAHHSLSLSLEPSALRPSSRLCLSHPAQARPPFFTVTIYSSFLLFVRNGHKNQCKTISVGVLFYITKNSS